MKKIIALCLAGVASVGACGCSQSENVPELAEVEQTTHQACKHPSFEFRYDFDGQEYHHTYDIICNTCGYTETGVERCSVMYDEALGYDVCKHCCQRLSTDYYVDCSGDCEHTDYDVSYEDGYDHFHTINLTCIACGDVFLNEMEECSAIYDSVLGHDVCRYCQQTLSEDYIPE